MNPRSRSMIASVCSVADGDSSEVDAIMPPDALVIVIQDQSEKTVLFPLPCFRRYQYGTSDTLPVLLRKAGRAYSEHRQADISIINVSG